MKKRKNVAAKVVTLTDETVNSSFSENALKMMRKRYLFTDESGKQEVPADMFRRVAKNLAEVERNYEHDERRVKQVEGDFYEIMARKEYTPAGRTLTNAGTPQSLIANCIVLPIRDSMESIFGTLKDASLLQQAGSGLGFAIDEMRPSMWPTKRSRGHSSGPVSFLKVYNEAFGTIKQQGRHGANMAMMSVNHPDVLDFIRSKEVEGEIRNFNISVKVTDEFMKLVEEAPETKWYCEWSGEKLKPRKVLRHPNGSVYGYEDVDITVGEMFDEIVEYAWLNGEPGIVFIDEVNRTNPLPSLGPIACSNPCGEQFLHPYDNCNLGSINLAVFVKDGKADYARLRFATKTAVRLMDNVIDRFDFPVKEVTELAKKNRRIGLGIMGFADMLYQLGIKYNSEKGYETAEKVMSVIQEASHEASAELAKEKGAFPNIKKSIFAKGPKMRNAALTTVAPTGSISMMYDTSSGVEPNFALAYVKQDKDGVKYHYLNRYFEEELKRRNFSEEKINEIKEEVMKTGGIQKLDSLPQDLRDTYVISMDIPGGDHVKIQAAFQKHVDNSISKTINFPGSATREDVKRGYIQAWKAGCKSCTVYRDGSRNVQVLNVGSGENMISITDVPSGKKREAQAQPVLNLEIDKGKLSPRTRPAVMSGKTYKMKIGYGNLYVTINDDETGAPFEVFAAIGKTGGFFQEQSESICRLISLSLRAGIKVEEIIDNLKGIRGPMPVFTDKGTVLSLPDAIARILEEHVTGKKEDAVEELPQVAELQAPQPLVVTAKVDLNSYENGNGTKSIADYGLMPGCPECGEMLQMSEGCLSCRNCGFTRCL
ncbi:MAG: Ribonucleoside-diphosphate reductase [Candidatus Jorgensenbacteria bacterium GW2011_GWA1_48_13]|uniref:Vitamin B12-dependent ribonucleotide reductase n=2 Tax=Candidatus Joergenseniibacteriota TaxID=1752739 RepID=A0A0G1W9F5_9BACT|nr:MAG: Ribonucleoside-diphosphate reductase [Candidatus Jorgensenbacteria bacterium GW2011_GWA1_48_13]KKU98507.1 MAG: Ribonucleoside-diphosphate reductase [Candidatus Jorgensenbacteria bacterium GW2011_GWC1_48_8]KKW15431.1 MAG: Ribonucleoside-diphosphate reductase [Candidatus Jorgensenbacteria bacterium GW2011_GWB1_50_10]